MRIVNVHSEGSLDCKTLMLRVVEEEAVARVVPLSDHFDNLLGEYGTNHARARIEVEAPHPGNLAAQTLKLTLLFAGRLKP